MIHLTRLNGVEFVLNSELIEYIESTPDTVITLTNGHKYVVLESMNEVVDRVIKYKWEIFSNINLRDN
ncbi:flagellar FlbD family protein [Calorimonas adulescens]|jgi:Flagellar protein (FlbD).|uniref:Flagellar FlbD family protein n=1 Tax=Calorimonas adulescens TaxID=2606906 RepID=A0A5D8QGJ9_9THEO|nr:flagellar FlbD family protein [Calorimonas adulescens]TZE83349.1 flagellar FlbD family protein [Calorimonas adulescens]